MPPVFSELDDRAFESLLKRIDSIAKDLQKKFPKVEYADLIQGGSLGLLNASIHYDRNSDKEFQSYAWVCARNAIFETLNQFLGNPRIIVKNRKLIEEIIDEFEKTNHRIPFPDEIAELTGLSTETVTSVLRFQKMIDIDDEISEYDADDEKFDYADVIVMQERRFDKRFEDEDLINIGMAKLSEKEQDVVLQHFYDGYTFDEIATPYHCTLQNIHKMYDKALSKMRDEIRRAEKYGDYPMRA